jgi:hypothetical protein
LLSPDDAVLRAAFDDLRAAELTAALPWSAPARVAGRRVTEPFSVFRPLAMAALLLVVITSFVANFRTIPGESVPAVTASWEGPTDFLLNTPQKDVLKTVPQFGERSLTR